MSATAGRRRRARSAALAKARRQKKLAIVAGVAFLIVVAIQGPRIVKQLRGSSVAAVATTPVTTTTPETIPRRSKELGELTANRATDPFSGRYFGGGEPAAATGGGRRDPFSARVVAAAEVPQQIVVGKPRAGRAGQGTNVGSIVVLASVPTREGRLAADQIASRARRNGVRGIAVLQSSTRKPLRAGYYVVYVGPYRSQRAANAAAAGLHARGYGDAYIRQLVRY